MDFSKAHKDKTATGMNRGMVQFLLDMKPPPPSTNLKKLFAFFTKGGHLKMEIADTANNTKWFEACREKGFLDAMIYHREGIGNIFPMTNWDKWVNGNTTYYVLWDTDGLEEDHPLLAPYTPCDYHKKVEVPNKIMKEDIADWISDEYGLCVASLSTDP